MESENSIDFNQGNIEDLLDDKELEAIFRMADFHIEQLRPFSKELVEQIRHGTHPLFALDFQELFCYMYPYSDRSFDSAIINYFLEKSRTPFVLLDGTVYELTLHLSRLMRDINLIPESISTRDVPNTKAFQQIERIIDQAHIDRTISRGDRETLPPLAQLVGSLLIHNSAVKRLYDLFEKAKFVSIQDLYPDLGTIQIDDEAFHSSRRILDAWRPNLSDNNFADALNIAAIVWMRNNPSPHRFKPFLVTHTPALLRPEIWIKEDDAQTYGITPSLFKSHYYAFYTAVVSQHSQDIRGQLKFVDTAIDKCAILQRRILQIPSFYNPPGTRYTRGLDQVWALSESWMQKLALSEDLQAFHNYFVEPFTSTIETYLAENSRRNVALAEFYQRDAVELYQSELETHKAIERLKGLIQSILDLTRVKTGTLPRQITDKEVSPKYPALNLFSVQKEDFINEITGTKKFRLLDSNKELITVLEQYKAGFYSVYWQTLISVKEFIDHVNKFIEQAYQLPFIEHKVQQISKVERQVPDIQGIILKTNKRELHFTYSWPIDSRIFIEKISKDEIPLFLRINTYIGDFYLDIFETERNRKTVMGMMSHIRFTSLVIRLFSDTSRNYFWPKLLEFELNNRITGN